MPRKLHKYQSTTIDMQFPCKSVGCTKVPKKKVVFLEKMALGKILMGHNVIKRGITIVIATVDHMLIYCTVSYELFALFLLFGV